MPEWEISFKDYLRRMRCTPKLFENKLNLPRINDVKKVLPLRNLKNIDSIVPIKKEFLLTIIKKIKTIDGQSPFKDSVIKMIKIDSSHLKVGQKFVYRENYQSMLENLSNIFSDFSIPSGICDLGAYMVFGKDKNRNYCLSYYIPPIIEKHGSDLVIMDGIHRNFINKQVGSTPSVILVENINVPFPCSLHSWDDIKIISLKHKPKDINKRYFDLNAFRFRDLKYLGIDG